MLKNRRRLLVIVAVLLLTAVTGMILLLTVFKDSEKPSKKAEKTHKLRSFECKTYAVEGEERELIKESKQEVNENGIVVFKSWKSYDHDEYAWISEGSEEYDNLGRLTMGTFYEMDSEGKTTYARKIVYEYEGDSKELSVRKTYLTENGEDVLIRKSTYEYYTSGQLASLKDEKYDSDTSCLLIKYNTEGVKTFLDHYEGGVLIETFRTECDSNGRILVSETHINGELDEHKEYRYDDRGVEIERKILKDGQLLDELSYDPKTMQVYEHKYLDDEITGVYTYDEKGRIVESIIDYNERQEEVGASSPIHRYEHCKYQYNPDGTYECRTFDENSELTDIDTFYSDGKKMRQEHFFEDIFGENGIFIYEYDTDGDMVLMEGLDENGDVWTRDIVEKGVSVPEYPGEKVWIEKSYSTYETGQLTLDSETIKRKMFLDGEEHYVVVYEYSIEDGEKVIDTEMKESKDGKTIEFHEYYKDWDEDYELYERVKIYDEYGNLIEEYKISTETGECSERKVSEYTYY